MIGLHIKGGLLLSHYTLYGCFHDILPWSVGDLWSLAYSSCSQHIEGGCLLGGCLTSEEKHWEFQRRILSPI
jgi:hypothetical protein